MKRIFLFISFLFFNFIFSEIGAIKIASGFDKPIYICSFPSYENHHLVLEQKGTIKIIKNNVVMRSYFLDIRDRVHKPLFPGDEMGLLGLAFDPNFDIINPSFTINSNKERISIKAKKGNFINSDLILLEKNVSFKSSNFTIYSDRAIFDKKEQTAESKSDSVFESNKTEISSEGFKIIDQGEVIFFNGKTSLIIEQ